MIQTTAVDCLRVFVVRQDPGVAVTKPAIDMEHEQAWAQQERTAELLQLLRAYLGLGEGKGGDAAFRDHFSTRGKATDTLRRCRPGPDFVVDKPEDEDARSTVESEESTGVSRVDQSVDEMTEGDIMAIAGAPEPEPDIIEDAVLEEEEPDLGSFFGDWLIGNIEHDADAAAPPCQDEEAQPARVTKRPRLVLPGNVFGVAEIPVDDVEREVSQEPGQGYVCKKNVPTLDLTAFKIPDPKKPRPTKNPSDVTSPLQGVGKGESGQTLEQRPALIVRLKLDLNRNPEPEPAADADSSAVSSASAAPSQSQGIKL